MRVFTWLAVLVLGVACAAWFGTKVLIEKGATALIEDLRQDGMRVETTSLSVGGFPTALILRAKDLTVADPVGGTAWQAPDLTIQAPSYAPWHLRADLPPEQVLTSPMDSVTLRSDALALTLTLSPALDLPLAAASASATRLEVVSTQGWTVTFGDVFATLARDDTGPAGRYLVEVDLAPVQPPAAFRQTLAQVVLPDLPAPDFPEMAEVVRGQIALTFSAPLALNGGPARPELTGLDLIDSEITWGALTLRARGAVTADANGFAAGKVALDLTNWDRLPALLVAAGVVAPEIVPTLANGLRALAAQSPDPATLSLPLLMSEGRLSLGPFPLGPAPRLRPPEG